MLGLTVLETSYKWHSRYLNLAKEVSNWSKDPSSKIGAVAIGSKGQVLSQGYNGFPRGISDSIDRYENKELKYSLVVHAEMNCIYNATYNGISLDGSTLYVHGLPICSDCAKGIIQVGINTVVMGKGDFPEKWTRSFKDTSSMFDEAGVKYYFI